MRDNRGIIRISEYDYEKKSAPWGVYDQVVGFRLLPKGDVYLVFPGDYHNNLPMTDVDGKNVRVPLRAYKIVNFAGRDGKITCRLVNDSGLLRQLGVKIASEQ